MCTSFSEPWACSEFFPELICLQSPQGSTACWEANNPMGQVPIRTWTAGGQGSHTQPPCWFLCPCLAGCLFSMRSLRGHEPSLPDAGSFFCDCFSYLNRFVVFSCSWSLLYHYAVIVLSCASTFCVWTFLHCIGCAFPAMWEVTYVCLNTETEGIDGWQATSSFSAITGQKSPAQAFLSGKVHIWDLFGKEIKTCKTESLTHWNHQ